jgi:hypothetical protein
MLTVELQEAGHFSVLLEWKGFDIGGAAESQPWLGFHAECMQLDGGHSREDAFAILVSPEGDGLLSTTDGGAIEHPRRHTTLVLFPWDECMREGEVDVLGCKPPDHRACA